MLAFRPASPHGLPLTSLSCPALPFGPCEIGERDEVITPTCQFQAPSSLAELTHNPSQSLPVTPSFRGPVPCSVDPAAADSCLRTPSPHHNPQMRYSALDYRFFLDPDRLSSLGLGAETHRCCPSAVDCSLTLVGFLARNHPARWKIETSPKTYPHDLLATLADSEADFAAKLEIAAAVGSDWGFAASAFVPRLLGQGSVVVSVNSQKGRGILCDLAVSYLKLR